MKRYKTVAQKVARRARKAEEKLAKAQAKVAKFEAKLEAARARLEARQNIYKLALAEAEEYGVHDQTPVAAE